LGKGDILVDPSPIFARLLSQTRQKASQASAIAERIARDGKKAALLARIEAAVSKGDLSWEEIKELFAGLPEQSPVVQRSDSLPERLLIAPGWEVRQVNGAVVLVVDSSGKRAGLTSTSNDLSWVCPTCGNKGPWNGVICLSCGSRSDPND
jgi:hypothetical protein